MVMDNVGDGQTAGRDELAVMKQTRQIYVYMLNQLFPSLNHIWHNTIELK